MVAEDKHDVHTDDAAEYERSPTKHSADNPLAAIKNMRLQQLAVCRLNAAEEIQTLVDKAHASNEQAKG